jgi:hypothetical protein
LIKFGQFTEYSGRKLQVKLSLYMPGQALRVPRVSENRHMKVVRLSALCNSHLYSPEKYPFYSFLLEAESTPQP